MESMASMVIPVLESRDWDTNCLTMNVFKGNYTIQWNLNLVTTFDLVTIFQKPFFNLLHKNNIFSDIIRFSDSFCGDQKCH